MWHFSTASLISCLLLNMLQNLEFIIIGKSWCNNNRRQFTGMFKKMFKAEGKKLVKAKEGGLESLIPEVTTKNTPPPPPFLKFKNLFRYSKDKYYKYFHAHEY